jgi:hypothetical protein
MSALVLFSWTLFTVPWPMALRKCQVTFVPNGIVSNAAFLVAVMINLMSEDQRAALTGMRRAQSRSAHF